MSEYFPFDTAQAKTLQRLLGSDDAGLSALAATSVTHTSQIAALMAWATALATKLNADAGVTDTNYDTTP